MGGEGAAKREGLGVYSGSPMQAAAYTTAAQYALEALVVLASVIFLIAF